jgi:hypothetical protein
VPLAEQVLAEVGAEESGAAGNHAGRHRADATGVPPDSTGPAVPAICGAKGVDKRPEGGSARCPRILALTSFDLES